MKQFKDLGIQNDIRSFVGEKIGIRKILNREIVVIDYKIEPSKYPEKGNGKRLCMQIELDKIKRISFTGSVILQNIIEKIEKDNFPFQTIIIENNERFEFT